MAVSSFPLDLYTLDQNNNNFTIQLLKQLKVGRDRSKTIINKTNMTDSHSKLGDKASGRNKAE